MSNLKQLLSDWLSVPGRKVLFESCEDGSVSLSLITKNASAAPVYMTVDCFKEPGYVELVFNNALINTKVLEREVKCGASESTPESPEGQ